MSLKPSKNLLLINNLSLILNNMIPGDNYMPYFTRAVKIDTVIQKFNKNKILRDLKNKQIKLNKKDNWDDYVKILGNDILEAYFTSKLVIKALDFRKKNYLKKKRKENINTLLKKVNLQKKYYRN
jgi:hypothetical protein